MSESADKINTINIITHINFKFNKLYLFIIKFKIEKWLN